MTMGILRMDEVAFMTKSPTSLLKNPGHLNASIFLLTISKSPFLINSRSSSSGSSIRSTNIWRRPKASCSSDFNKPRERIKWSASLLKFGTVLWSCLIMLAKAQSPSPKTSSIWRSNAAWFLFNCFRWASMTSEWGDKSQHFTECIVLRLRVNDIRHIKSIKNEHSTWINRINRLKPNLVARVLRLFVQQLRVRRYARKWKNYYFFICCLVTVCFACS